MSKVTPAWLVLLVLFACGDDDATLSDAGDAGGVDVGDAGAIDTGTDAPRADVVDGGPANTCADCSAIAPWRCEPCLDARLQEITAVEYEGGIVVAGGFEPPSEVVTTVRKLDPATGVWTTLPALPDMRHHVAMAVHGGDLYLLGGMRDTSFEALSRSYVLRSGATAWVEIAPPPRPRAAGVAGTFGDVIVVAGGQGEGRTNAEKLADAAPAMIYTPASDSWTLGAPIPTPREHVAGFGHEGELWVLGGRPVALQPTHDEVEIYDPVADAWRAGPTMPTAHGGFAAAVLDGVAYAGGGEEPAGALDVFESLDLATGIWSTREPLPTPRHGHAMAAALGRVYLIGGADRPVFAAVDDVESFAP